MTAFAGPRAPSWTYWLLDKHDNPLKVLDGVHPGGTVEAVALSRLGGSGALTVDERGQQIDWMSHRVQVVYDPGIRGVEGWPVATMLLTSPTERHTDTGIEYDVTLLPKLAIVDEDTVEETTSYAAGTPIIQTVVGLIESAGETRIAVTESDVPLRSQLVFDAGESKLTIINKLLEAAGYWSLWCDGSGQFRVEPYVDPAQRPIVYEFAAGEASIVAPEWERDQDLSSVPNRFIVIGQGTDEDPPLVGVAENIDPASQFSFPSRGRWITRTVDGVEGADQAVFDQLAGRHLEGAMSPVARMSVTHAIVPVSPNELVTFSPLTAEPRQATIMRVSYRLTDEADCDGEWRELQ